MIKNIPTPFSPTLLIEQKLQYSHIAQDYHEQFVRGYAFILSKQLVRVASCCGKYF